ncbi:DNA (cytosine-5-)-methyltransferase [Myroides odoratimimus]|nr:DNA (cytosine-5-)-methyltransferase [Myroides odoratimimus]
MDIGVVDLFCGIGGLSHGMYKKGFDILSGFDIDDTCKYAYEFNNKSKFHNVDISKLSGKQINEIFADKKVKVLAGCAPCQPFSSYAFKVKEKDSSKYDLLYEFGRLVKESKPHIVTMENVAQILSFKEKPVLNDFVTLLENEGYFVQVNKVFCPDYGIPQKRSRLVLLASIFGEISLIAPTHSKKNYNTVRKVIGKLPKLEAGEVDTKDPLHRARILSDLNLKRIKATPQNGGWKDWPEELLLECHKKESGKTFSSVYGRMNWDEPAPTMTTLCTGLGNGRFGHPEQDRAISLREAAIFQTFPKSYRFFKGNTDVSITKASRYIGNAVPPKLGEVIAISIINHLKNYE